MERIVSQNTKNVTSDSLEQLVDESECPVVVDLWAPWCSPCRTLGPTLDQLAQEFEGRVVVAKINIVEDPKAAAKLEVKSIPTLLFYRDGKLIDRQVGAPSQKDLKRTFEQLASGK
jgi:thioredoxin 1